MSQIDAKLDKIQDDIVEIKLTLAENTASLKEHMRRTAIAEERIEALQEDGDKKIELIVNELKPIQKHVMLVNATVKLLPWVGAALLGLKELGLLSWITGIFR